MSPKGKGKRKSTGKPRIRRGVRRANPLIGVVRIPTQSAEISFTKKFRYQLNGPAQATYTATCFDATLMALICSANTTTAMSSIIGSVRLKRVEVWCQNGNAGNPLSVNLQFPNVDTGALVPLGEKTTSVTDTVFGTDNLAHVVARPTPGAASSMWLNNGTPASQYPMFLLTLSQPGITNNTYAIIDVTVDIVLRNQFVTGLMPVASSITVNTTVLSVGEIYYTPIFANISGAFNVKDFTIGAPVALN